MFTQAADKKKAAKRGGGFRKWILRLGRMLCWVITVSSASFGFSPLFRQGYDPAMKILENVPVSTPASNTKANSLIAPPPKKNSEPAASRVVPEVIIVRLSVLLMATFMISVKVPGRPSFKSSRMRSKITMVSLIEKPMIVRRAAITGELSSPPQRKKIPIVMRIS